MQNATMRFAVNTNIALSAILLPHSNPLPPTDRPALTATKGQSFHVLNYLFNAIDIYGGTLMMVSGGFSSLV